MRSCKTVSELTALNKVRPLSMMEKVSIFIHRAICAPCRAYKKQMDRLQGELAQISDQDAPGDSDLGNEARRRILENIRANTQEKPTDA